MPNELIVTGFDEVNKILKGFTGEKLRKAMRRAQRAALRPVHREAKRLTPVGQTGNLRRSVKLRAGKRKRGRVLHRVTSQARDVRNAQGVYYGGFVHWGTRTRDGEKLPENDWLKRAADNTRNEIEGIMARVLREELEGG